MANEVKITLSAVDKASATIKKMSGGMVSSMVDVTATLSLAKQAFGYLQQGIAATIGEAVAYNKQIREMKQVTGLGAEEISRLVQVADDWQIDIGSLRSALSFMNRRGIVPSIDNLAKLADEYVATSDKSKFAAAHVKDLGRQYQTLIPMLALGGTKLREATAAVDENLIATDDSIAKSREYEVELDDLQDKWHGLAMKIGLEAVPKLTEFLELMNELISLDAANWFDEGADASANFINKFFFGKGEIKNVDVAITDLGNGLVMYKYQADQAALATEEFADATDDAAAEIIKFRQENWKNRQILQDEAGAAGNLAHGFQSIGIKAKEGAEEAKTAIEKLNDIDLNIGSAIQDELDKIKWEKYGGESIAKMKDAIDAGVNAGIITKPEAEKALEPLMAASDGLQSYLDGMNATEAAQKIQDDLNISFKKAKEYADSVFAAIKAKTLEDYVINVVIKTTGRVILPSATGSRPGKASGGSVMPWQSYVVGERGPEVLQMGASGGRVIPNNVLGGDVTVNVYASPGMDETGLAYKVANIISSKQRLSRYAGTGYAGQ